MKYVNPDLDEQIQLLIRDCGQQAVQMAAKQFLVSQKGPDDYVTSVDRALDQQLLAAFSTLCPQDGIITEENIQSRQAFHINHYRQWLIDPLDGTDDFIQGKRDYAVMVGLLQEYQPVAGWIYAPALEQMYYGGPDWGLFQRLGNHDSEPLLPVQPNPPSPEFCPVLIGYKDQNNFGEAIARLIPEAQFYSLGSFGLKVLEVICGRAGIYLYLTGRVKLWDTTGPLALAKTAGLICCDLEGQPLSFTPDAINPDTLAHEQSIVIGWPDYVESLLPRIRAALV
jgi:3'(2'), 5'-bisphosphate nucleotidase